VNLTNGVGLVKFDALTISELVWKVSYAPSRMLGLLDKGHLTPGADADVVVLDLDTGVPDVVIVGGRPVVEHGVVTGTGGTVLTSPQGERSLATQNIPCRVVDVTSGWFYGKHNDRLCPPQ
jgi:adenine deaminase